MDNNSSDEINIKAMIVHKAPKLRIDKCVPVLALKEKIAVVTGVSSVKQYLICRGRFLRDDKLLSDYHVEDGDTLHLIVKQDGPSGTQGTSPGSSSGHRQGNHSGADELNGTWNLSEQEAQDIPTMSEIVSGLVSSIANVDIQSRNVIRTDLGSIHLGSGYVPSDRNINITIRTGACMRSSQREQTGSLNPGQANVGNSDQQTREPELQVQENIEQAEFYDMQSQPKSKRQKKD